MLPSPTGQGLPFRYRYKQLKDDNRPMSELFGHINSRWSSTRRTRQFLTTRTMIFSIAGLLLFLFIVDSEWLLGLVSARRAAQCPLAGYGDGRAAAKGAAGGAGGADPIGIPSPLPRYSDGGSTAALAPSKYTLMINTFKRPEQLAKALRTYERCPNVDSIRVIWSEQVPAPTASGNASLFSQFKDVLYDKMPTTSFNNRFTPVGGLRTEAVVSIDDDVYMPCASLDRAFKKWRENPRQLVGFFPRAHLAKPRGPGEPCALTYSMKLPSLWLHRRYSVVLTKAAFMHRDYLEIYTNHMPHAIRAEVDRRRNCEDIAMQFLVSYISRAAPVAVPSLSITDVGQTNPLIGQVAGVSAQGSHLASRSGCLEAFTAVYGGTPLVSRSLWATQGGMWLLLQSLIFWR